MAGLLDSSVRLSDILAGKQSRLQLLDFAVTRHLSIPLLRLVYIPYSLDLQFSHVPSFPEGFRLAWYVTARLTVEEVIEAVLNELGIREMIYEGAKKERVEFSLNLGHDCKTTYPADDL